MQEPDNTLYQTPSSELLVEENVDHEFYVVSPNKFLILFFSTMGIYRLYWFYKHWSMYKSHTGEKMLPIMRTIFSIFFAHSLFARINDQLINKDIKYKWSPSFIATIFVISVIIENILDRASMRNIGSPVTDILTFCFFPVTGLAMYKAQTAANLACGDKRGESNNQFTFTNYFWLLIGVLLWGLVAFGFYEMFVGSPE